MRVLLAALLIVAGASLPGAEPGVTEPETDAPASTEMRAADRRFRQPRDYARQARLRLAERRQALRAERQAVRERRHQRPPDEQETQVSSDGSNVN